MRRNKMLEPLIAWISQNYIVLIILLIVIAVVISVIKSVIKWILTVLIIGGVLLFAYNNASEIKDMGAVESQEVLENSKEAVVNDILDHNSELDIDVRKDGTYTITTGIGTLEGSKSEKTAVLTVGKFSVNVEVTEALLNTLKE
jgi:hypothetical protein